MSDRPILFSPPMIRAMLDGRKSQTRRVLKLNGRLPEFCGPAGCQDDPECWGWEDYDHGDWITLEKEPGQRMGWRDWRGAYAPGDRLWVRETWSHTANGVFEVSQARLSGRSGVIYRADENPRFPNAKWWPSMFMPREFSRLTLIVTDVRVQRVQDIGEADAIAEGLMKLPASGRWVATQGAQHCGGAYHDPRQAFAWLWNGLNGPRGYGWDENPWVAALTFTVHRCNIDQMGEKAA